MRQIGASVVKALAVALLVTSACGGLDFWIPPKFSKIIAKAIPHSVYVDMPDCGHIAVRDDPEGSAGIIKDFLAASESRMARPGH